MMAEVEKRINVAVDVVDSAEGESTIYEDRLSLDLVEALSTIPIEEEIRRRVSVEYKELRAYIEQRKDGSHRMVVELLKRSVH